MPGPAASTPALLAPRLQAGLATFPNSPQLLILYGNFLMEVRKDGPASRAQLQLVAKQTPNFVERYQVKSAARRA